MQVIASALGSVHEFQVNWEFFSVERKVYQLEYGMNLGKVSQLYWDVEALRLSSTNSRCCVRICWVEFVHQQDLLLSCMRDSTL
jgi:hypothetical protein